MSERAASSSIVMGKSIFAYAPVYRNRPPAGYRGAAGQADLGATPARPRPLESGGESPHHHEIHRAVAGGAAAGIERRIGRSDRAAGYRRPCLGPRILPERKITASVLGRS